MHHIIFYLKKYMEKVPNYVFGRNLFACLLPLMPESERDKEIIFDSVIIFPSFFNQKCFFAPLTSSVNDANILKFMMPVLDFLYGDNDMKFFFFSDSRLFINDAIIFYKKFFWFV